MSSPESQRSLLFRPNSICAVFVFGVVLLSGLSGCNRSREQAKDENTEATNPKPSTTAASVSGTERSTEYQFFEAKHALPPPSLYVERYEEAAHTQKIPFNGAERSTRSVTLAGVEFVFDPSDDSDPPADNNLLHYHKDDDIVSLTIFAERVVIRGQLHLPGTDLAIYAAELRFEDQDKDRPAHIMTTPIAWRQAVRSTNDPVDGSPGQRGGDIKLCIGKLHVSDPVAETSSKRFILKGGRGQKGSDGKKGAPGHSAAMIFGKIKHGGPVRSITGVTITEKDKDFLRDHKDFLRDHSIDLENLGKADKPKPGGNAISAGKPGVGGDGGHLFSTAHRALRLADQSGGLSGEKGLHQPGGPPGEPRFWCHVTYRIVTVKEGGSKPFGSKTLSWNIDDQGFTDWGEPAEAPGADKPMGSQGEWHFISESWVRPENLRVSLEHIRDAFLAGRIDIARASCIGYLEEIDNVRFTHWQDALTFESLRRELMTIAHRIASGLDYFGHPPGWVPMLSLEQNYEDFRSEIKAAINTSYLAQVLDKHWSEQQRRLQSIDDSIKQMQQEMTWSRERFKTASSLLPELRRDLAEIHNKSDAYVSALGRAEADLVEHFADDKEKQAEKLAWLRAAKEAAFALAFSGEGAVLGAPVVFGTTLEENRITGGAPPVPRDAFSNVFRSVLAEPEIDRARQQFAELDPAAAEDPQAFAEEIIALSKTLSQATRDMVESMADNQLAYREGGTELQQTIEADAGFKRLFDELVELVTQKQLFAIKVAETVQAIESSADSILEAQSMIDSLDRSRDAEEKNMAARLVIRSMNRRAKERLYRSQYYLAKAYEYRMLEPLRLDFHENKALNELTKLLDEVETDVDRSQLVDRLTDAYIANLKSITRMSKIFNRRGTRIESTVTLAVNKAELEQLNEHGTVVIDLEKRLLFESDVDSRLQNVRVLEDHSSMKVSAEPDVSVDNASLELTCEPAGHWVIHRWDGKKYAFTCGQQMTNHVRWGYTWDSIKRQGANMGFPDTERSVLAVLAHRKENAGLPIHFRPGARTKLKLRKEVKVFPANAIADVNIDRLTFEVTVDKFKKF